MSRYSLIETLGYKPDRGFVRLDMHLERMRKSSAELGFSFSKDKTLEALRSALATAGQESALRIRIELSRSGTIDIQCEPYSPISHDQHYRITSASSRITSDSQLIRHKTTERTVYKEARSEFPADKIDEVILLNERNEVCEGTITNLFVRPHPDGPLLTPALGCGLLPGILRSELLHGGRAKEAILTVEDLAAAEELYVGNSLRGLIRANYASLG